MSGRIKGQLLKGTTTLLVLSVLREGELYGYEIAQRIRDKSGGAFIPSEGSLYPALHSLEPRCARCELAESDRGPRRRYYKITKAGLGMLEEHATEWAVFSQGMARAVGGADR